MRYFNVIVCKKKVTVIEHAIEPKNHDISANVDGDTWLYKITKVAHHSLKDNWRERGYVQAYYHAKNNGSYVEFNRVDSPVSTRKRKRHPAQLRLFH